MKKGFLAIGLIWAVLIGSSAFAHADPLTGSWTLNTTGQALIGAASTGTCSVSGITPASLYDAIFEFERGSITIRELGINMGVTNCASLNFQGSGSYTVTEKGDGNFEANGTFTTLVAGRAAACRATQLTNVAFTVTGKIGSRGLNITIHGLDSGTYAEGPPPGPLNCTAGVLNLTLSGTGKRF